MRAIGANTWIWASPITDETIAAVAPRVAELGFDFMELPVEEQGAWDPVRVTELLSDLGLGASVCCVMPPGRDLAISDDAAVEATQYYLRYCVDVAQRVGSGVVAGPMYAAVGRLWRTDDAERRATIERVATGLRPVAEHAAERGVKLAVEPLNRYETSLINTVDQGLELVESVGHDAVGLLLDTFHMNIEEKDTGAAIARAGDRVLHFHTCENDRGAPGSGGVRWDEVFGALAAIGYDRMLVIEAFTPEIEEIARAVSTWRPVADSPDVLARDGLGFLRERLAA